MSKDGQDQAWLTAAQCAARTGLTVRALRLYEQAGLIRPHRTAKDWRLYGAAEVARLNEILILKRLGLSLQDISGLLAGKEPDLERMLTMQTLALQDKLSRIEQSLTLAARLKSKIGAGDPPSLEELLHLAKEMTMTDSADSISWRRYEQARPRVEQAIDPALYQDYDGAYRLDGLAYVFTYKVGRLFARLTGQPEFEVFPEAVDRFFYKVVPAQITFERDGSGDVCGLVLHQNGLDHKGSRIDRDAADVLEAAIARRVRDGQPVKDGEALLRQVIAEHQRGEPDERRMATALAAAARSQSAAIKADLDRLGQLKSLTFKRVSEAGWDVYEVTFDQGRQEWSFAVSEDGKFSGLLIRPLAGPGD